MENRFGFASVCVQLVAISMGKHAWEEAESYLPEAEKFLSPTPDAPQSFALLRFAAEVNRVWASVLFMRREIDRSLVQVSRGIVVLQGVLDQEPTDTAGRAIMYGLWRGKAWVLSREGKADAFTAWDKAVEFADGSTLRLCRVERALERALIGEHLAAVAEAGGGVQGRQSFAANPHRRRSSLSRASMLLRRT